MLLTIATATLEEIKARLEQNLRQENNRLKTDDAFRESPISASVKRGLLAGVAHEAADEIVAHVICPDARWPKEYQAALYQEVARSLAPEVAAYGITEVDLLAIHPKRDKLVRPRDITQLDDAERDKLREKLGDETAARLLDRIQSESVIAVYGMLRRETVFKDFDAEGRQVECPRAGDAVLNGLFYGDEKNVPPTMLDLAQSLLQLNRAKAGCGPYPDLATFKTQLRAFYIAEGPKILPHAIKNGEDAGRLLLWDREDESYLPPVQPEMWARMRPAIEAVAGEEALQKAELQILEMALDRLGNADYANSREEIVGKVRVVLSASGILDDSVESALSNPTPDTLAAARIHLHLPINEQADAVLRLTHYFAKLGFQPAVVKQFQGMALDCLDDGDYKQVMDFLRQLEPLMAGDLRTAVEELVGNPSNLLAMFLPESRFGEQIKKITGAAIISDSQPAVSETESDLTGPQLSLRGHHRGRLSPSGGLPPAPPSSGSGFPR